MLDVGCATRDGVNRRWAIAVSPFFLVVVGRAVAATDDFGSAVSCEAGCVFPFAPLPRQATILWAVVKLLARIHLSSPLSETKNGCRPLALTTLPEIVVIFNT